MFLYIWTKYNSSINDARLKSSVPLGLAFHHAGLSLDDREHIENAYRKRLIRILLSTNTLAMGVNLPAHTIIIKNTEVKLWICLKNKSNSNQCVLSFIDISNWFGKKNWLYINRIVKWPNFNEHPKIIQFRLKNNWHSQER